MERNGTEEATGPGGEDQVNHGPGRSGRWSAQLHISNWASSI